MLFGADTFPAQKEWERATAPHSARSRATLTSKRRILPYFPSSPRQEVTTMSTLQHFATVHACAWLYPPRSR